MDRRMVLTGITGLALSASPVVAVTSRLPGLVQIVVGTFGHEGGKGTHLLETSETANFRRLADYPDIKSASFGAYDNARQRLYVTVRDAAQLAAYSVGEASLKPIGAPQPSMANNPCYVSLSPDRKYLATANFTSDVAVIYALNPAGEIQGEAQILRSEGAREDGHAHWVQWSPDGKFVYVVDLGHEEVRSHAWDQSKGLAGLPKTAFSVAKGSGPRHMAFSPGGAFAFLLTEKSGELIALRRGSDGTLSEIMRVKVRSDTYTGEYAAAHIAINTKGDRVYISERGPDTISVYGVAGDGRLAHLQTIASGGAWPRFFLLLEPEKRLLGANQRGHSITSFEIQPDGTLIATDIRYAVEAPVYVEAVWRP